MGSPYIGEIRMFGGNFPPMGWAFCDGQLIPISENDALFALIGTTYGGDGQATFALPDLQGRFPIHMGTGPSGITYQLGEMSGVESVTLSVPQMPAHTHPAQAGVNGEYNSPNGHVWASWPGGQYSNALTSPQNAANGIVAPAGGSLPHENMPPFRAVSFIISLFGVFPSQS